MEKTIKTIISRSNEAFILAFCFENPLNLNLSSMDTQPVQNFFQELLKRVFDDYNSNDRIIYEFELDDNETDLFHDVAEKYVKNLNSELKSIYTSLDE